MVTRYHSKCCGSLSSIVELQDGQKWRRHVEHLVRQGKQQQEKEEKASAAALIDEEV